MIGLFGTERFDCHPWSLSLSAILTFIYVFSFYFGFIAEENYNVNSAGLTGIAIQAFLILLFEGIRHGWNHGRRQGNNDDYEDHRRIGNNYLRRQGSNDNNIENTDNSSSKLIFADRPDWDIPRRSRFGEKPLTPKLLWKMMEGVNEPFANPWYVCLMFYAICMVTPWTVPGIPTNVADLAHTTVNGLPWWAVKIMAQCTGPSFLILVTIYRMPKRFPVQFRQRAPTSGSRNRVRGPANNPSSVLGALVEPDVDPDVMELTPEEMGCRTTYDARNEMVYKRRRQILEKLGISRTEIDSIVESTQQQLQDFRPTTL
jgi:hypothetical protein